MKTFVFGLSLFFGGVLLLSATLIAGGTQLSGLQGYTLRDLGYVQFFGSISIFLMIIGIVISIRKMKDKE